MKSFIILCGITSGFIVYQALAQPCQRRVCILHATAMYDRLKPEPMIKPEDINLQWCTHLNYGFAYLNGTEIVPESLKDLSSGSVKGDYEKVTDMRTTNPNVKFLFSFGGWSQDVNKINNLFTTKESLANFVNKVTLFLRENKFNGLDVMWLLDDSTSTDVKNNLAKMIKGFREEFNKEKDVSKRLLLTSTVYGSQLDEDSTYEHEKFIGDLDWVNILVQDLMKYTTNGSTHHSALFTGESRKNMNANLTLALLANQWLHRGIPKEKIVMGIPFFGRSFTLTTPNASVGAPITVGSVGKYVKQEGYIPYYEICEMIRDGAKVTYIEDQRVPYLVYKNQWIGYDNEVSVKEKVKFIRESSFGGVIIFPINDDDYSGEFCDSGKFPLLKAVNDACSQK